MTKAIIVGAGIGGLCTAIALHKIGMDVQVYEQASAPRAAGAGLTLWSNAIKALQQIGAFNALESGCIEGKNSVHRWDGIALSTMDSKQIRARYGFPAIGIHRTDLMNALLRELEYEPQYGKRFMQYDHEASGVRVTFEDGSTVYTDVLIGADGIHSIVRQQMHPDSHPIYQGYAAWRGVLDFEHRHVMNRWGETWGRGARFGIIPLNQNRVYWFASANRPEATPPEHHKNALRRLYSTWHQPIPQLIEATVDDAILYNDIADIEPLSTWIDRRVVLLGDAAHAMTPNMGQGACQAIEDAAALMLAMGKNNSIDEALETFESIRLSHTKNVMMQSRRIGHIGQVTNPVLEGIRNAVMKFTPRSMTLRQLDTILASKTS